MSDREQLSREFWAIICAPGAWPAHNDRFGARERGVAGAITDTVDALVAYVAFIGDSLH